MEDDERLRQHYAKLDDEDILELALHGAETLRPEALDLLRSEVSRRRLGQHIQEGIDVQLRELTPAQQAELVERFRQLPCPLCGDRDSLLNAFIVAEAKSFIVVTAYREWLLIGCPQCIQRAGAIAYRSTMLLGWWGFPMGIFRTLQALGASARAKRASEHAAPTPELLEYVKVNRGKFTALIEEVEVRSPNPADRADAETVQKAIALQNMQAEHMGFMLTHLNPTGTNGEFSGDCVFMLLPFSSDLSETELGILISELKVAGEHPCSMRVVTNHTEIVVTPNKLPELILVITPTGKGTLSKKENGVVSQIGLVEFAEK